MFFEHCYTIVSRRYCSSGAMDEFIFEPVHLQTRSISVTRDSTFVCTAWAFREVSQCIVRIKFNLN